LQQIHAKTFALTLLWNLVIVAGQKLVRGCQHSFTIIIIVNTEAMYVTHANVLLFFICDAPLTITMNDERYIEFG